MSKATSLNNIEKVDPNVSQQIDNVLAEIESNKNNQISQQQQPQMIQKMPPMQGQQLPPPQQIPPPQMEQLPEMIQSQPPQNYNIPNNMPMYPSMMKQNQSQDGILGFLSSFLLIGDDLKNIGIIVALFVIVNLQPVMNLIGKYLTFTIDEIGNSTILGSIIRGIILSFVFVLITKFI